MTGHRYMGKRFDGHKNVLSSKIDIGDFDSNFPYRRAVPETQEIVIAAGATGSTTADVISRDGTARTTKFIVRDLERLVRGRGEKFESEYVRDYMREQGWDPDNWVLTKDARVRVHNLLVADLQRRVREAKIEADFQGTTQAIMLGKDDDPVIWSIDGGASEIVCTVAEVRAAMGMSLADFMALEGKGKMKALRKITHRLRAKRDRPRAIEATAWVQERTRLHIDLLEWNRGELKLERPQASSLHHLMDYDERIGGMFHSTIQDCQCVVVENNWGASVPPIEGEWRVMFPLMCWEFRISGVRVLAFTDVDTGIAGGDRPHLWIVYGRGGHWAIDDYFYECGHASLPPGVPHRIRQNALTGAQDTGGIDHEMRRVAAMVYACIRGICIMREAEVAEQHLIRSDRKPTKGVGSLGSVERKRAPRDYYVVRLVNFEHRSYRRARSAGYAPTGERARQRGHWRAATWVHYDDPDSGQVQYANDGGFFVSKTWRGWHFAGDPNNIIHKEYRA